MVTWSTENRSAFPTAGGASCFVPGLSLCLIVRNEAENIERCLTSVEGAADEVVVVDTGSTDGTQDIAARLGARVIQSEWRHDFSEARNLSLANAQRRWILVLDADEVLQEEAGKRVRALLAEHTAAGDPAAAFNLINKSSSDGGRTGTTAHLVRLFPNRPNIRYRYPIHEQIAPSLLEARVPIVDTDLVILHSGYADPEHSRAKQRRNLAILERQIAAGRDVSPLTYFMVAGCHLDLGDVETALARYEDSLRLAGGRAAVGEVPAGALVRIVECLVRLKRYPDAIARSGREPDATWHPEMLALRAQAEAALGRTEEARHAYEMIFGCPDRPRFPACDFARLKIEALGFLADYWRRKGNPARGVALLRAAVAIKNGAAGFDGGELQPLYDTR